MAAKHRGRPPKTDEEKTREIIQKMADRWPSAIVARRQVGEFTGGMIAPETLNVCDARRIGPKVQVKTGAHVGYPVDEFCRWLLEDFGLSAVIPQPKPVPEILRKG